MKCHYLGLTPFPATEHSPTVINHFVGYDGNGNVFALANAANSSITAKYEYSAFGEPTRVSCIFAKSNPFRWSTKYTDEESGLVYYGHRYYSAGFGRWLSRDPIDQAGGLHLYAFVINSPLNGVDQDGRIYWLLGTMAIGGIVGAFTSNDPWRGFLQGAAAGAVGYGVGWVGAIAAANITGSVLVGVTIGSTASTLASTYSGFVMDNYAAGNSLTGSFSLSDRQKLTLAVSGAGSMLLGAFVGASLAKADVADDVNDAVLDLMLGVASTVGVSFRECFRAGCGNGHRPL